MTKLMTESGPKRRKRAVAVNAATASQVSQRVPFEGANRVVGRIEVTRVSYTNFHAQGQREVFETIDASSRFSINFNFLRPKISSNGQKFQVDSIFLFTLAATNGDVSQTLATVRAGMRVVYALNGVADAQSEDDLSDFALCYMPFHCWGFWRELVHSSLARLEIPPYTLPVYRITMAPSLVVEALAE